MYLLCELKPEEILKESESEALRREIQVLRAKVVDQESALSVMQSKVSHLQEALDILTRGKPADTNAIYLWAASTSMQVCVCVDEISAYFVCSWFDWCWSKLFIGKEEVNSAAMIDRSFVQWSYTCQTGSLHATIQLDCGTRRNRTSLSVLVKTWPLLNAQLYISEFHRIKLKSWHSRFYRDGNSTHRRPKYHRSF